MDDTPAISDARRMTYHLDPLPGPVKRPVLVALAGLPGTGKSTLARRLAERVPFLIVASDAMRQALFPHPDYSPEESTRLFQAIHQLIGTLLSQGISVIFDATNLSEKYREPLYAIAARLGIKLVLVWTQAPPSVAFERLQHHRDGDSEADWSVYLKMKPAVQKIRRRHFVVDTSRDTGPALDKIIREIQR